MAERKPRPAKDGGPAFPRPKFWLSDGDPDRDGLEQGGMSLRDYFAGQALVEMCGHLNPNEAALLAYEFADALLAARDKEQGRG